LSNSHAPRVFALLLAASFAVVAFAAGCRSDSEKASESTSPGSGSTPVLQFGAVAEIYEHEDAREYEGSWDSAMLRSVRVFGIKDARVCKDPQGRPAVLFLIADAEKDEFRRWTGSLVGRRMALLLDGKVVATPMVKVPLPGAGVVMDETRQWNDEEAKEIAERIRKQTKPPGS